MEKEITKSMPIFPALNKKRKNSEIPQFRSDGENSKSNKIFQILNIQNSNDKNQSILTHRIRRFDLNRKTLFSKPRHQMTNSKQMIDSSLDPDDISKTRPFSLEERNLNINDISFSRILRSDHALSSLNTTRIIGGHPQPPSFYEKDIQKWKNKFENAIKNRLKLKKVINDQAIDTDSQRGKIKSRGSAFGTVTIDVEAKGNTNNVDHLLRKRIGGNGNNSQLEFEVGLRKYVNATHFKPTTKWDNVIVTNSRNSPLNEYKTEKGKKTEFVGNFNLRQSQFCDKYNEKNVNALRHLFKADQNVRSILWENGLRSDLKKE